MLYTVAMTVQATATYVTLDGFDRRKGVVASALREIQEVARLLSSKGAADTIGQAVHALSEERFRLVVVGEFSNGKSTLINALLGDRVLPSSVQPTTAVLSIIQGGETPQFVFHYRDHRPEQSVNHDEFMKTVAPPEPDRDSPQEVAEYQRAASEIKGIAYADIRFPTNLLAHGVELVDTPGTNDLDTVREQITYEFVPKADAVIFLLSAKAICKKSEINFLKDRILKADIQRLFFAINFADFLKTDSDREKVIEAARKNLRPIVGDPRLFLVCSKDALAHRRGTSTSGLKQSMPFERTGFQEFERSIASFLDRDRGAVKLEKPIAIGTRIASEVKTGPLAIRKGSVGKSVEEVRRRMASLKPQIAQAEREKNEVLDGLRSRFANEGGMIAGELRRGLESIALAGVAAVDGHEGELTGEAILQTVERSVAPMQTRLVENLRSRQESALRDECARAQRRIEAAWGELQTSVDHVFTMNGATINVDPHPMTDKEEGQIVFGGTALAGLLMTVLHLAFPIVFFAGVLTAIGLGAGIQQKRREHALGQARAQIDERLRAGIPQAMSKFDAEWARLTDKIVQAFEDAFRVRVESLQSQMVALESQHSHETANAQRQRQECDELALRLDQAARTLANVR